MDIRNRKIQYDLEIVLRWTIGTILWLASCVMVFIIGQRFWVMFNSYYGAIIAEDYWEMIFAERSFLYIMTLIVGCFCIYLFFLFIDQNRHEKEIFLIEDHPYFKLRFIDRIDLMRVLKLFLIISSIGLGAWLVTWLSMVILAVLTG
jgi:hypothetical protein